MGIFLDSLVAVLAVLGVYLLFLLLYEALSGPIRGDKDVELSVHIRAQGKARPLESCVRKLLRLRSRSGTDFDIIILDGGLDEAAARTARALAAHSGVILTTFGEETKELWTKHYTTP